MDTKLIKLSDLVYSVIDQNEKKSFPKRTKFSTDSSGWGITLSLGAISYENYYVNQQKQNLMEITSTFRHRFTLPNTLL